MAIVFVMFLVYGCCYGAHKEWTKTHPPLSAADARALGAVRADLAEVHAINQAARAGLAEVEARVAAARLAKPFEAYSTCPDGHYGVHQLRQHGVQLLERTCFWDGCGQTWLEQP